MQVSADGFAKDEAGVGGWTIWDWCDDWPWDQALRNLHIALTTSSDCILLSPKMVEDGFMDHWADIAQRHDNPQVAFAAPIAAMRKVVFSRSMSSINQPNC